MKKWESYIEKQKSEFVNFSFTSEIKADIVIVIPCFNEPNLLETLNSLCNCEKPDATILVAIIVNSGIQSDKSAIIQNRKTFAEVNSFANTINNRRLSFHSFLFEKLPKKHAGVGLARKIGMDIAVKHFIENNNHNGVIVSLDADCLLSENFLVSIYSAYKKNEKLNCTIHNILHRAENNNIEIEKAVRQYEAYLSYFRGSLENIGFPYYYQTIGSAFAVSADAYVRVGGMGRQQGGEDFYFLQKIFALENTKELHDTYVYPLARFSDRVPFGTGPALQKIIDEPEQVLKVYSRQSFTVLKQFFDLIDEMYKKSTEEIIVLISSLNKTLQNFLNDTHFIESIVDCNENSASLKTFKKRFFHNFNAFKIIKYLNSVHPEPFMFEKITSITGKL